MKTNLLSSVIALVVMIAFMVFSSAFFGIFGFIVSWFTSGIIFTMAAVISDFGIIVTEMSYVALKGYWNTLMLMLKVWWYELKAKVGSLFSSSVEPELAFLM